VGITKPQFCTSKSISGSQVKHFEHQNRLKYRFQLITREDESTL
jgi:hypothetical protein